VPNIKAVCPTCGTHLTINFKTQPVVDLVCEWSEKVMADDRPAVACVRDGDVIIAATVEGRKVITSVKLGKKMPHQTGGMCVFSLLELSPGVLKLSPSVLDVHQGLHAYVTIVGTPPLKDILA
jgi:hypothetical protein